jgi:uridylate kinase
MIDAKYQRVLLKLSGEAFEGGGGRNIDPGIVNALAGEVRDAVADGTLQMALVVGGGNFWRGRDAGSAWIARPPITWA